MFFQLSLQKKKIPSYSQITYPIFGDCGMIIYYSCSSREGRVLHSTERREKIIALLQDSQAPQSATAIAKVFAVSRQVVVGDIALLRAAGYDILATPRGYIMQSHIKPQGITRTIACNHHGEENLALELFAIVDNGGKVIDVTVEHPLYGQISAELHLSSRYDVEQFLQKLHQYQATPLSQLTHGIHLHTIQCQDEEAFSRILSVLEKNNILLSKD